jgi:hypothetical protein
MNITSNSCGNGQSTAILGALGSLIGFIAAELPVDDLFERQFWPQRFFNHLSWSEGVKIALLLPMGGPLYQVAFRTLDCLYKNGLFSGTSCGHMLGTPFFPDNHIIATLYNESGELRNTQPVRNCLWIRVLRHFASNSGSSVAQKNGIWRQVRARTFVTFLELSLIHHEPPADAVVDHDTGRITLKCILSIVLAEITGIITAIVVVVAWRSVFAIIWLLPLLLRLLSVTFVVSREGLPTKPCSMEHPALKPTPPEVLKVEIRTPVDGFLVIQGPSDAVFPFTRHYGHPVRNKVRESMQIGVIIGFGLLFPIGLLCSLLWMQEGLQYMWLSYQMYSTTALYIYRYAGGAHWATTESRIAKLLSDSHERPREIFFKDINGVLKARMSRTIVGSQAEGRKVVQLLINGSNDGSTAS